MRPHTLALLVVWAYLQKVNATKRAFRVTISRKSAQTGITDTQYVVNVTGRSDHNTHMQVRLNSGGHILPVSMRYECAAILSVASASRPNTVYLEHPYHNLSIPEEVEFYFNGSRFKLTSRFASEHNYFRREARVDQPVDAANPAGLRVESYHQNGSRYELEIKYFFVDG